MSAQKRDVPVFVIATMELQAPALAHGATAFHARPVDRSWLLIQLQLIVNRERGKILLIDDDEISRYVLKGLFANSGFQLLEATCGTDGLRFAQTMKPRLIILDLSMPDFTGFEVLEKLKGDSTTRDIPVVIYTSQELDSSERDRLQAAVDIVPKGALSRDMMVSRFSQALSRANVPGVAMVEVPAGMQNLSEG